MRRILVNALIIVLLVGGDALWRLVSISSDAARNAITFHITAVWTAWVSIVAGIRVFLDNIILGKSLGLLVGVLEWAFIFATVHIFLCWLDTVWEPADNFKTVVAFTFVTLFIPAIVISSAVYVLGRLMSAKVNSPR